MAKAKTATKKARTPLSEDEKVAKKASDWIAAKKRNTKFYLCAKLAPGYGLDSYQFPPAGHIFNGGREALTTWRELMTFTRGKAVTIKPKGGCVTGYVCSAQVCEKCPGMISVDFPNATIGDRSVIKGTVLESKNCLCPFLQPDTEAEEIRDENLDILIGRIILHINAAQKVFVVNFMRKNFADKGNNGQKSRFLCITKDRRCFEAAIKKQNRELPEYYVCMTSDVVEVWPTDDQLDLSTVPAEDRLNALAEVAAVAAEAAPAEAIGPASVDTMAPCGLCYEESNVSTWVTPCCPRPSCCRPFCFSCCQRIQVCRPTEFIVTEGRDKILKIDTANFNDFNSYPIKCPHCREEITEYILMTVKTKIIAPHGWIGNRAAGSEREKAAILEVFERIVKPYFLIYKVASEKFVELFRKEEAQLQAMGYVDENLTERREQLMKFLGYCHAKMYEEHKWLQDSSVPIPENLREPHTRSSWTEYSEARLVEDIINGS